jgi:hypothetical protein
MTLPHPVPLRRSGSRNRMRHRSLVLALSILGLAACSSKQLTDGNGFLGGEAGVETPCPKEGVDCPTTAPSYISEVAPLLALRCNGCHAPDGEAADRPLTSRAQIRGIATTVVSNVYACKMPPPPLPQLTDAERTILVGWIACGEPDN